MTNQRGTAVVYQRGIVAFLAVCLIGWILIKIALPAFHQVTAALQSAVR